MESKISPKGKRANPPRDGQPVRAEAESKDPLYLQVARALKEEIVSGVHPVGSQLPTEDELGERFSVSRYTVREALRRLREENLVSSRQGAGTVVVPPRSSESYIQHAMSINDLVDYASGKRFATESIKMVMVDRKLQSRTGLAAGDEWLEVRGFRHAGEVDSPVCLAEYYINRKFAAVGRLLQRHNGPIFPLIEDMYGLSIVEVHQEITATLIPPALADGLRVKAGTAALEVRRTYKTPDGEVAQITINTHPASRFSHSMTMHRVKS